MYSIGSNSAYSALSNESNDNMSGLCCTPTRLYCRVVHVDCRRAWPDLLPVAGSLVLLEAYSTEPPAAYDEAQEEAEEDHEDLDVEESRRHVHVGSCKSECGPGTLELLRLLSCDLVPVGVCRVGGVVLSEGRQEVVRRVQRKRREILWPGRGNYICM